MTILRCKLMLPGYQEDKSLTHSTELYSVHMLMLLIRAVWKHWLPMITRLQQ